MGFHQTVEKGHGRIESRRCGAVVDPENLKYVNDGQSWPHWQSLVRVESTRRLPEQTTLEVRYFISSLPRRPQPYGPPPACIGSWMSASGRTAAALTVATALRIWRALRAPGAGAPSIYCARKPQSSRVSPPNANVPAGTWIISIKSWSHKMQLPWRKAAK